MMAQNLAMGVTGTEAHVPSLSPLRLIPLGVAFWVAGVVCAHLLAPLGAFTAAVSMPLLLATLPAAWLTVRCGRRLLGLTPAQLVHGTALLSTPALLLDGTVLTWAPALYSPDPPDQRAIAAWLLWFVGAALVMAWVMAGRKQPVHG